MRFNQVIVTRSYEQVVAQIADGIRDGALTRGQKLPTERELAASFGVSRAVVREAIKVLAAMGLVEPRQGSGLYVRNDPLPMVSRAFTLSVAPTPKSVGQIFEIRRALEAQAARSAAQRRTEAQLVPVREAAAATARAAETGDGVAFGDADRWFHAAVRAAADNPYLAATLAAVREVQEDVVRLFIDLAGSIAVAAQHHLRVAEAIAASDAAMAGAAMEEHIDYTAGVIARLLQARTEDGGSQDGSEER